LSKIPNAIPQEPEDVAEDGDRAAHDGRFAGVTGISAVQEEADGRHGADEHEVR
jgi:hypothetical protein